MNKNIFNIICYTNEQHDNLCHGVFYETNNGEYELDIESDDFNVIKPYHTIKLINGEYNSTKCFITEFTIIGYGNKSSGNTAKFFVKIRVFRHCTGKNCFDLDSLKFDRLICKYNYLGQWIKGINSHAIDVKKHLQELAKQEIFGSQIFDKYDIGNGFSLAIFIHGTTIDNFHEEFDVYFEKEDASYIELLEKMNWFGKLLSLFCFSPVETVNEIYLINDKTPDLIKVYTKQWIKEESLYSPFIINYQELRPYFADIVKKAYNCSDKLKLTISMIDTSLYSSNAPGSSIDNFLEISKVIESMYDSELYNFKEKEKQKKVEIKDLISQINDSSVKRKIKKLVNSNYRVSFEERLNQFFKDVENDTSTDTKNCFTKLAKIIANTRNYYTHLDNGECNMVFQENELQLISYCLTVYAIHILIKYLSNNTIKNLPYSHLTRAQNSLELYCTKFTNGENK